MLNFRLLSMGDLLMRSVFAVLLLALPMLVSAQDVSVDEQSDLLLDQLERQGASFSSFEQDPLIGEWVVLHTAMNTRLLGYVAGPRNARQGILLLHDRWGLNGTMRQRVEAFARRGYRALAIDVFDGRSSDDLALATEILNAADPEWVKVDLLAGVSFLAAPARKVAVMGWGFGGWQAYQAALLASDKIDAAIVWYAPLYANISEARAIGVPLMGVFAGRDERVSPAMIASYKHMTRKSENVFRSFVYDAGYGFADPQYHDFNEAATKEAWEDVNRFLASYVEN